MRRFEYSPLGKELKAQTEIAKKEYQKLGGTFKFDNSLKIQHLKTIVNQI